jgi:membrane protein implicated in regulation of membrane protease activity
LNGELWQVQADNPLQKGDEVVVKGLDGITLRVGKINVE